MRKYGFTTIVSALALGAATALGAAQPAAASDDAAHHSTADLNYVALGDSYSSGVGAGDYIAGSGTCMRSNNAYGPAFATAHDASSFHFDACSGATTDTVTSDQLDHLTADTDLVSISVGGNDIGFADIMSSCVTHGDDACLDKVDDAKTSARQDLPAKLDDAYDAIHSKAPNAQVVVVGYPQLFTSDASCVTGISKTESNALNEAADVLNGIVSERAAEHGFTYADVTDTFSGHQLCSSSSWLHGIAATVVASFHPTADGQSDGYLPALESAAS